MAIGGLGILRESLTRARKDLNSILPEGKKNYEIKWQTTRADNLKYRKAYVDYLVDLIEKRQAHFHIRFSPMKEYTHDGPRKRFDTVSKAYYQLLLHRPGKFYGKTCKISVRPDDGDCTSLLKKFLPHIERDAWGRYGANPDCFQDVVCLNSKSEPLLQLLDVSLGALTAYRNGRHDHPDCAIQKKELANYTVNAFAKVGLKNIKWNADPGNYFSVWNVIPKKQNAGS